LASSRKERYLIIKIPVGTPIGIFIGSEKFGLYKKIDTIGQEK